MIKLTSSLIMSLAFRIFDSIRYHSISGTFKNMCFGKVRRCRRKKLQEIKQGPRVLTLVKGDINLSFKSKFSVYLFIYFLILFYYYYFFFTSNFCALIILQPETIKLNVTKSYILVNVVGVLALVQPAFLCGEVILTTNCNNRNYYISVSKMK